jgi:uncharacterized protein
MRGAARGMRYRRFGKTELELSVFSLGTMRCLGSAEVACQTVKAAIDQGINHLETAQAYGPSELFLGGAIQSLGLQRSDLYLTTKVVPTSDADAMAVAIDRSLQRLGVDYVDCLAIHGVNTEEHLGWVLGDEGDASSGCWTAVAAAQAAGKVRHVGFSTHGSLELILRAIASGRFSFVNLHYYYFFQRHAPAIALAQALDLGVFIISPADKGGQLYTPSETLVGQCAPLSPLQFNYRFLLSDPRITTLSLGPAHAGELWPSLAVADEDGPLTEGEQAIAARLEAVRTERLGTTQCSQCYQCLPCPEGIAIPEVLRLRNLTLAHDLETFGKYRYQMFENAGHWFPGRKAIACTNCGDCLPRCPEGLNIPDLLRETHGRLEGPKRRRLW